MNGMIDDGLEFLSLVADTILERSVQLTLSTIPTT
jgi:hypothetical protein